MNREEALALAERGVEELIAALEQGKSERLLEYLAFQARFHRYSFNNCLLIAIQKPDATFVAGFQRWKELNRFVRKGEKGINQLQEHLSSLGGMDASSGMGQAIAVGYNAGKRLVDSPEFKVFVRNTLIPKIRAVTDGAPEAIRVVFIGSLPGGTYSGAEVPISTGLSEQLLGLTSATVTTHSLSTGGLTYEGLGDNTWKNSASALMEQVRYCTDPSRNPREVRRLRLIEFEVLGQDEALRDACLAQVEQASLSSYMILDQRRRNPNDSLSGQFGNIQTWEAAFGNALEVSDDIIAVAHEEYGAPLKETLNRETSVAAAERIEVVHERVRLNRETVGNASTSSAMGSCSVSLAGLGSYLSFF